MRKQTIEIKSTFVLPEERAQLVQFCARFTRNGAIAEDLAQETLLEAWRKKDTLRDIERRKSWLFGIARNICLRWLRTRGYDSTHLIQLQADQGLAAPALEDMLTDDLDVEILLERKELVELLDQALALLPAETRTAIVQHYIESSPLAEIAARMGTNASAVAMRLQRGKLFLRRVLTQEMHQEFFLSFASSSRDYWEETTLWCPICGQRHLLGQRDSNQGKLILKCPACGSETDEPFNRTPGLSLLKGVSGYKRLYARLAAWCDHYYHTGLRDGSAACAICGRVTPMTITTPANFPRWFRAKKEMHMWMQHVDERVIALLCEHCLSAFITSLEGLVLTSARGQQFLQAHPRIRTLPGSPLEVDGCPAILVRLESVIDTTRLDIVVDEETYEVLHSYGGA